MLVYCVSVVSCLDCYFGLCVGVDWFSSRFVLELVFLL